MMKNSLYTIWIFTKVNTLRFFRDRIAIFFTIVFPLIFLFAFGGLFSGSSAAFDIALLNSSESDIADEFIEGLTEGETFTINEEAATLEIAQEKMSRGELDAAIVLPEGFGVKKEGEEIPSGEATIYYTENNAQASQILSSILEVRFEELSARYVEVEEPFTVATEALEGNDVSRFDYTFAGILGFVIISMGIFGPINVFPELKKQGILRRLHTTPLKVREYFVSTALSQAIVGLLSIAIFFAVGIFVFGLQVLGNPLVLALFLVFSIITILGIGLAIGGWAQNQSQAAPISNIIVFPMLFLSGTFFPRFLMPEWIQAISEFLPLTPVIDGTRLIITQGYGFIELAPQLLLLFAWAVIVYVIALRVFRWE